MRFLGNIPAIGKERQGRHGTAAATPSKSTLERGQADITSVAEVPIPLGCDGVHGAIVLTLTEPLLTRSTQDTGSEEKLLPRNGYNTGRRSRWPQRLRSR